MDSSSDLARPEDRTCARPNAVAVPYPRDRTIHEVFREQAAHTPDAVAVVFGGERLRYADLERRARRLAARLAAAAAGPETLVALCVQRSIELVVGMLAILEAGAAYLPLDPGYPKERLALMLQDAQPAALVVQPHLLERLPHLDPRLPRLSPVDEVDAPSSDEPWPGPVPDAGPENLAYVMYTSGSTGRPKGVAVPHRGVVRLVKGANWADLTPTDVFLQIAPISFDATTLEVWSPLLNGGRLVVPPPEPPSLAELARQITESGATTLWLTAGVFHRLAVEHPEALAGVRQLLTGGEVLSPTHVRSVLRTTRGRVIAGYGPTENTVFTTTCDLKAAGWDSGPVPIGCPVSNTRVFVLDPDMRPVSPGEEGELYTGGDGLARGYHGVPDLTAERFVPDPFGAEPGGRLYRTGDLARQRPDGDLDFVGRIDLQVKIRGFRVEPGEVEAVLRQHPAVREAVVAARPTHTGDKRLIAYVVPNGTTSGAAELRSFCRERLPDHMVPAAFQVVDALPLSPNGKVDVRGLPDPDGTRPDLETAFVAPRTPLERALSEIWQDVLRVDRVGVDDHFFDLGGHSLSAMEVVSRAREALGVDLALQDFFAAPTVAALAAAAASSPPPIERVPRERLRVSGRRGGDQR